MRALARTWRSLNERAAVSPFGVLFSLEVWLRMVALSEERGGRVVEAFSATSTPMVAAAVLTSASATTLAALLDITVASRTLARLGRSGSGSAYVGPCRNPRNSPAGLVSSAVAGDALEVGDLGVSPSATRLRAVRRSRRRDL